MHLGKLVVSLLVLTLLILLFSIDLNSRSATSICGVDAQSSDTILIDGTV